MSNTYTHTSTQTFTRAHAKKISYRVAADLKRMQRFYGRPTDKRIREYDQELVELLTAGYLENVTYGFWRNDTWIEPTLRYRALALTDSNTGDDPGRIRPGANISGASFYSYLIYSNAWFELPQEERRAFEENLPFKRGYASEPGVDGHLQQDLTYSAGGRGVRRESLRSWT